LQEAFNKWQLLALQCGKHKVQENVNTEHFAGAFPTWLAPVQVRILPISDAHKEYASKLKEQ
jgi:threonyl-tRNA synthetase